MRLLLRRSQEARGNETPRKVRREATETVEAGAMHSLRVVNEYTACGPPTTPSKGAKDTHCPQIWSVLGTPC